MERLTAQEEQAMLAVWKTGEGNVKSFMKNVEGTPPPYTTLASTIKNLERKGFISSRLVGNTYVYKPAVLEADYKKKFMSGVVRNYFENSYKELVSFFVEQKKLSAEELREIVAMIENQSPRT